MPRRFLPLICVFIAMEAFGAITGGVAFAGGVMSREMLEQRAAEALRALYAGRSETPVRCVSHETSEERLRFIFRCGANPGGGPDHLWSASTRKGEVVELAPVNEGADSVAPKAGVGFPPHNDPNFVRRVELSAADRRTAAEQAR